MLIIPLCCDKMPMGGEVDLAPRLGVSVVIELHFWSAVRQWSGVGSRSVVKKSCSACSSHGEGFWVSLYPSKACPRLPPSSKKSHLQVCTFLNFLNVDPAKD